MSVDDVTILLVEDDEVDAETVIRGFRKCGVDTRFVVARDGLEALARLRAADPPVSPNLVLLDVNMPRMNGHEFLDELRSDPRIRRTVVFVLSTSDSDEDKRRAYDRNVAGYLLKGNDEEFLGVVELLDRYCRCNQLPIQSRE